MQMKDQNHVRKNETETSLGSSRKTSKNQKWRGLFFMVGEIVETHEVSALYLNVPQDPKDGIGLEMQSFAGNT